MFFSDAVVDIAMPGPFLRNLGQGISVANSLAPRDPKSTAARNNEAYGQGNGRLSFRTIQTGHWNLVFGRFTQ